MCQQMLETTMTGILFMPLLVGDTSVQSFLVFANYSVLIFSLVVNLINLFLNL